MQRGDEAWQRLQEQQSYDLALLDIRMPGMTGLEVCRRLRESQGYALPVLMLTALGTTDDIVLGLQAGADDYMVKPFKFTEAFGSYLGVAAACGELPSGGTAVVR